MRTLLHLPASNFEQVDDAAVEALFTVARDARLDVAVVTGEVTPSALRLLDAFPSPQVIVPGSQSDDAEPIYEDEQLVVASLVTKHGPVRAQQFTALRVRLCSRAEGVTKFVVTHDASDLPHDDNDEDDEQEPAPRTPAAVEALARCGADVLLAHGLRRGDTRRAARRYELEGRTVLVVRAGLADSFNLVRVQHPHLQVERHAWRPDERAFRPASSETFRRTPEGWERLPDEVAAGITFADDTTGLQPTIPQQS